MGNSGIRKLWFLDSPVETHYKNVYQINVINIHKQEESLSQFTGQQTLIVNIALDSPKLQSQLEYLKTLPYQVLLFPKCDNQYTYKDIAQKLEGFKVYQKVELNGEYTHPLYKYLKRNTPELYNSQLANGRKIREDFTKFLISEDGQVLRYLHCDEKLHLYKNPSWLSKLLIQEYTNIKSEELAFRYAALAKLRTQELDFQDLHQRDISEQWEISKMALLPQIYTLLTNLHRATRQDALLTYPQVEAVNRVTALLDPNMFPVQDLSLKLHTSDAVSVWQSNKQSRVLKNVGFSLDVRASSIDHQDAGDGVFLRTAQPNQSVPPGTFLGFVPGVFYDDYSEFNDKTPPDMHFFRFDGPILDFTSKIYHPYQPGFVYDDYQIRIQDLTELAARCSIPFRNKSKGGFQLVHGEDINPYAVGHKINHTPINSSTNVCLIDVFVPQTFFPLNLMKFWPSQIHSSLEDFLKKTTLLSHHFKNHIRGLGFISVREIKDGEELFLDYLESCLFDMNIDPPDWLIKPPPLHPQICKQNLRKENLFMMWLEDYAFSKTKDGQNFDKFYRKVIREQHQQIL